MSFFFSNVFVFLILNCFWDLPISGRSRPLILLHCIALFGGGDVFFVIVIVVAGLFVGVVYVLMLVLVLELVGGGGGNRRGVCGALVVQR